MATIENQEKPIAGKLTVEFGVPDGKGNFTSTIRMDGKLKACEVVAVMENYVQGMQQLVRNQIIAEGLEGHPDLESIIESYTIEDLGKLKQ